MLDVIKSVLASEYGTVIMATVILGLTELIKLPIKALTNRIPKKYKWLQILINTVFVIIPFALGVLAKFLFNKYLYELPFTSADISSGIWEFGSGAIALYELFIARIKKAKKDKGEKEPIIENPYETEEGQAVIEVAKEITADGVVDEKDKDVVKDAVKDFYKKINK